MWLKKKLPGGAITYDFARLVAALKADGHVLARGKHALAILYGEGTCALPYSLIASRLETNPDVAARSHVDQGISDPSSTNAGGVPYCTAVHDSGQSIVRYWPSPATLQFSSANTLARCASSFVPFPRMHL